MCFRLKKIGSGILKIDIKEKVSLKVSAKVFEICEDTKKRTLNDGGQEQKDSVSCILLTSTATALQAAELPSESSNKG